MQTVYVILKRSQFIFSPMQSSMQGEKAVMALTLKLLIMTVCASAHARVCVRVRACMHVCVQSSTKRTRKTEVL